MFLKKDQKFLSDVFTMARLYTVNNAPENKTQLQALMGIESVLLEKMNKANEELGFVEPEDAGEISTAEAKAEEAEKSLEVVEENTATDPGATD